MLSVLLLPGSEGRGLRRTFAIRSAVNSVFGALLVFIALNPYLYSNPLVNTARMFKFRVQEMSIQVAGFSENVLPNSPLERLGVISQRIFENYAWPNFPGARWPNLTLAAIGLGNLLWRAWRWLRRGENNPSAAVLLVLPAPLAAAALATPLDWDRYYLFPILLAACCGAAGLGAAARRLWKAISAKNRPD